MSFLQIREVIRMIRHDHERLSRHYKSLESTSSDERIKTLLDYMSGCERNIELAANNFEHQMTPGTLNTWVQFSPRFSLGRQLKKAQVDRVQTPNQLIGIAISIGHSFVAFYARLSRCATAPGVCEIFHEQGSSRSQQGQWCRIGCILICVKLRAYGRSGSHFAHDRPAAHDAAHSRCH